MILSIADLLRDEKTLLNGFKILQISSSEQRQQKLTKSREQKPQY
jgi:hypothetical protein